MEHIRGKTFQEFIFSNPKKRVLRDFLRELFAQAAALDRIGLDHGQLAGKGKNILVRENRPVIIDFEKASAQRKAHNATQLASFIVLSPHSEITRKIREILRAGSG